MLESGRGGAGERATTVHINKPKYVHCVCDFRFLQSGMECSKSERGWGGGVERAEGRGQLLEVVVGRGGRGGRWDIKLVLTRKRV